MPQKTAMQERAAVVVYLEQYAKNMRDALSVASRDLDGVASAFTIVGRAEAANIDLEAAADLLEEVAEQIKLGRHMGFDPDIEGPPRMTPRGN